MSSRHSDDRKPPEASQDTESLVRRLAGPSVTKAGQKDQTEINRIIAEVSKGSKFYENEKRKDKELTERIAKILAIKDDILKSADIELESERDLTQYIVHVDMDAFYASVELLENPDLAGKAFGVGKGVLCTASYEARKHGVRSGMAGFVAKKLCPELILLPLNFDKYSAKSSDIFSIFKQYDPNMLVAGCDEGYMNITPYCSQHDLTPEACVQEMRDKVKAQTNLTVSAGIAPNKICSDKNKPNGQFHLTFEKDAIKAFLAELPIRKLPGVGRVHERLLDSIGVCTCADIYTHRATISLMDKYFGRDFLFRAYLGMASNVVQPHQREERKSIGAERTFRPLGDTQKIIEKLEEVSVELEHDMESTGWAGKTVTLKYKLDTYQVFTRAKALERWVTKKEDLFNIGKELLQPELPLCLRLIGLRVTKLKDLRVPDDKGIKRRRKTDMGVAIEVREVIEVDDAMPGYHEHEDDTKEIWDVEGDDELIDAEANAEHSLPDTEHTNDPPNQASSTDSSQTCPICQKFLEGMDNTAINAHLDFCLSKGVIMEATSATAGSNIGPAKSKKPASRSLKSWVNKR
ncbi:DNA/RNA polymerase [Schizopora paradoxa]|uniref:DNA polymerase kappa n=1 Tax=Schizopora paradoxa TaxID=27342 RepID=A0A0H2SCI3_9AGAM|nr:DNA/RNA polymerase [Schizopora paradoxa]